MASDNPIHRPYLRHAFAKSVHKGEDFWLQQQGVTATGNKEGPGAATFDAFGIFDGHGGKLAAQFASKHLVGHVVHALGTVSPAPELAAPLDDQLGQFVPAELAEAACEVLSDGDKALWQAQDVLVAKLPRALAAGFKETQQDFWTRSKASGTTATVAALVGWEVVVANVGDSCAVLDTGSEVVQISGNHRLEDSKPEQRRCIEAGCEVATSRLDGKNVGPLRVWPGGLAMSRTIGDYDAGPVVLAEPEVRQVTLPHTGGRIIIASDGLWDSVGLKTAAHHVRGLPASKAANELVQMSLKARGLRDDITVLVIDTMPGADDRLPPLLARHNSGHGLVFPDEHADPVAVHRPLDADSHVPWRKFVWERRATALAAVHALTPKSGPMDITDGSDLSSGTHHSDGLISPSTSPSDAMSVSLAGSLMSDGMSEMYRELANLKAVPFDEHGIIHEDADDEDGWETVGKAKPESPRAPVTQQAQRGIPGKGSGPMRMPAMPADWQQMPSRAQKERMLGHAVPNARREQGQGAAGAPRDAAGEARAQRSRRDGRPADKQGMRARGSRAGGGVVRQNDSQKANSAAPHNPLAAEGDGPVEGPNLPVNQDSVGQRHTRRSKPSYNEGFGGQRGGFNRPGRAQEQGARNGARAVAGPEGGFHIPGGAPAVASACMSNHTGGATGQGHGLQFGSFADNSVPSRSFVPRQQPQAPQLQFGSYVAPGLMQPSAFVPHAAQGVPNAGPYNQGPGHASNEQGEREMRRGRGSSGHGRRGRAPAARDVPAGV